jgi:hypothetical protein
MPAPNRSTETPHFESLPDHVNFDVIDALGET